MPDDQELEPAHVYDLLRSERRYTLLSVLREKDGSVTIGELADRIATEESGENPPPRRVRRSAYVSLHQTHLPRLDNIGVIDYDTENSLVRLDDRADELYEYVYRNPNHRRLLWGVAGASVCGVVISVVGLAFASIAVIYVLLALFSALFVASMYGVYRYRSKQLL
jgi:hypothetical protein